MSWVWGALLQWHRVCISGQAGIHASRLPAAAQAQHEEKSGRGTYLTQGSEIREGQRGSLDLGWYAAIKGFAEEVGRRPKAAADATRRVAAAASWAAAQELDFAVVVGLPGS